MLKSMKYMPAALALALVLVSSSFAQQPTTTTAPSPSDNYVTEKNFKSKVFDVKYRDPNMLAGVLRQLGSGFKGATIYPSTEFKTLTVRDFPENIATIEEALKRLDTPASPRPNIELRMHVLIASNTGGTSADMPAELRDVLTQLRGTFNYRNYELVTSVIQRLADTTQGSRGKGTAEVSGPQSTAANMTLPYEYMINGVSLVQNPSGGTTVQISRFAFYVMNVANGSVQAQVETALNLRDGEKVVVGTATMQNRALVIVLTAELVK
jgi:type II secretory pathway component GspD/PulD (secretin)